MSMWEPRSSHLYVWTGLRVCEWLCAGAGTPCLCPCCGQSGTGCARQWCVRVCSLHMTRGHAPLPLSTCACIGVSKVCDPVRCLLICVARVGMCRRGCTFPVGGGVQPHTGLCEGVCGRTRVALQFAAVHAQARAGKE